jgi:hypothetical protein
MTTKEQALQTITETHLQTLPTRQAVAKALEAAYDAGHAAALTPKTTGLPDIDHEELQTLHRAKRKHRAKRARDFNQASRDQWQAWFDGLTKGQ